MELVASFPVDCLAATDPLARGPAPLLRPQDSDGAANAPPLPFELFLQLLNAPLPAGEALPVDGNGLPVPPSALPLADGGAAALAAADTAEPASTDPLDALAFERFNLTPALRAALPAPAPLGAADAAAASVAAGPAAPPGLDLSVAPDLPAAAPLPAPPSVAETATAAQSALAGLVADLAPDAAGEPRNRPRAPAASALPAVASAQAEATVAAAPSPVPATGATAVPPLAEMSSSGMRVRRDAAAPPLPLAASTAEAAGSVGTEAPAWHLPAGSHTTTAPGAAATPAAHGAPVDTRSPNWHDAFAGRIQWLVDHHVGEARIKLNPPELGAVDVKISLVDDKTFVQLTAGSAATRDELTQSLPRLRELLTASGLELGGAAVHSGHDGRGGYDDRGGRGAAPVEALGSLGDDLQLPQRAHRAAGRIDTFA